MYFTYSFFLLITQYLIQSSEAAACSDGWTQHGQSCYHVGTEGKRWSEAMSSCEEHKSHLVNIETAEEQAFVLQFLQSKQDDTTDSFEIWIGGSDWSVENSWVWEPSGTSISYTNWYPGQPNNRDGNENCLVMTTVYQGQYGKWFDEHCDDTLFYICEKSTTSTSKTTSSTSLTTTTSAIQSTTTTTTRPTTTTTTQSTTTTTTQPTTTTTNQPTTTTTFRQTTPFPVLIDAAACSDGWAQHGQSCYHVGTEGKRWSEAMSSCEEHKSHLVNIETAEEQAFVLQFMQSKQDDTTDSFEIWIGGSDWSVENSWVWEPSGTSISYTNWYPGQPNNRDGNENCLVMNTVYKGQYGKWFDEHCDVTLFYICEKSISSTVKTTPRASVTTQRTTTTTQPTTTTTIQPTTTTFRQTTPFPVIIG